MAELGVGHLQLLHLVAVRDLGQLPLQLCLGLEEVVGESVLKVHLLGFQRRPLLQASPQLSLERLDVVRQLLHLEKTGGITERSRMWLILVFSLGISGFVDQSMLVVS